ncbi:MAG: DUF1993 domain-containing protein [Thiobacillaceae bacterium]
MNLTMYQASVPVFIRMLGNLAGILEKAAAHCAARKIDAAALIHYRLYPDMFDFARQVQVACDHARNGAARLAGVEAPEMEKTEQSFAELIERVRKTIAYLETLRPEQFDGAATREVVIKRGESNVTYAGLDYLLNRVLPNFYFHVTTAYAILRHNGVELGKRDYIGR